MGPGLCCSLKCLHHGAHVSAQSQQSINCWKNRQMAEGWVHCWMDWKSWRKRSPSAYRKVGSQSVFLNPFAGALSATWQASACAVCPLVVARIDAFDCSTCLSFYFILKVYNRRRFYIGKWSKKHRNQFVLAHYFCRQWDPIGSGAGFWPGCLCSRKISQAAMEMVKYEGRTKDRSPDKKQLPWSKTDGNCVLISSRQSRTPCPQYHCFCKDGIEDDAIMSVRASDKNSHEP